MIPALGLWRTPTNPDRSGDPISEFPCPPWSIRGVIIPLGVHEDRDIGDPSFKKLIFSAPGVCAFAFGGVSGNRTLVILEVGVKVRYVVSSGVSPSMVPVVGLSGVLNGSVIYSLFVV